MRKIKIEIFEKEEIGLDKLHQAKFFYTGLDEVIWTGDPLILLHHIIKDLNKV